MAVGLRLQVQVMDFSSFTYFSNMLCAVKLRVLGLVAYWYTGSAFHQMPQSYSIIFKVRYKVLPEKRLDLIFDGNYGQIQIDDGKSIPQSTYTIKIEMALLVIE